MNKIWLVPIMVSGAIFIFPPARAHAGLCDYPRLSSPEQPFSFPRGLTVIGLLKSMDRICTVRQEASVLTLARLLAGGPLSAPAARGAGGGGVTGRCPDNSMAPAPNPPGAWKWYMVPVPNACKDQMEPAGFSSAPVLPGEGIPVPAPPPAAVGGPLSPPLAPETELP